MYDYYKYTPFSIDAPIELIVSMWGRKEKRQAIYRALVMPDETLYFQSRYVYRGMDMYVVDCESIIPRIARLKVFYDRFHEEFAKLVNPKNDCAVPLRSFEQEVAGLYEQFERHFMEFQDLWDHSRVYFSVYNVTLLSPRSFGLWTTGDEMLSNMAQAMRVLRSAQNRFGVEQQKQTYQRQYQETMPGFVYLMQMTTGHYKIGYSIDPERRVKEIVPSTVPVDVAIVHTIPTNQMKAAESQMHEKYADCRLDKGEWFTLSESQVAEICAIESMMFDWLPAAAPAST